MEKIVFKAYTSVRYSLCKNIAVGKKLALLLYSHIECLIRDGLAVLVIHGDAAELYVLIGRKHNIFRTYRLFQRIGILHILGSKENFRAVGNFYPQQVFYEHINILGVVPVTCKAFAHNGKYLVGKFFAAGASSFFLWDRLLALFSALIIRKITKAMMMKSMTAEMNAP